ncbi:MAG: DUF2207 domain-containing protein, partial [Coleofasciculus sp. C2-GNP5-27]
MFNSRQLHRIAIVIMAVFVTILIPITHSTASDIPFYWDSINVEMDVQPNGDMWVTETQHYVFTDDYTNERYRYIPLNKVDEITDVTVTENGQPLATTTGIENNQLWIRWQHPLNPPESHVFVVKYRVIGGIQINGDKTQVYWKAIFAERQVSVLSGTVTVHLPEVLSGQVKSYTSYGIPATRRTLDSKTFEFVASQALLPGQELEVQIIFPSSVLNLPQPQWQQFRFDIQQFFVYMLWSLPVIGIAIRKVFARLCP